MTSIVFLSSALAKINQLIDAQNGQPLPTVDVIFPIVHGTLGEDGSLQGMLRVANLPFVGSDVLASAHCNRLSRRKGKR